MKKKLEIVKKFGEKHITNYKAKPDCEQKKMKLVSPYLDFCTGTAALNENVDLYQDTQSRCGPCDGNWGSRNTYEVVRKSRDMRPHYILGFLVRVGSSVIYT